MVAAATTLRNTIESAWNLTGELSKTQTGTGPTLMDEVVQFWDRMQVRGNEVPKSVTVEKINAETNENIIRHPNFNEVIDIYEITAYYRVVDVDSTNFSTSLDLIESMTTEITSIVYGVFKPSTTSSGIYFKTASNWRNEDIYPGNQPALRRKMQLSLSTITSDNSTVFTGVNGILVFDRTDSSGVNPPKPATDYTFLDVNNVITEEGFPQREIMTKDQTLGKGVPQLMRGVFRGTFSFEIYPKELDIAATGQTTATTVNQLPLIGNVQKIPSSLASTLIGQQAEIVLIQTVENSVIATPTKLSTKSFLKVVNIRRIRKNNFLYVFYVTGQLTRPSTDNMVRTP